METDVNKDFEYTADPEVLSSISPEPPAEETAPEVVVERKPKSYKVTAIVALSLLLLAVVALAMVFLRSRQLKDEHFNMQVKVKQYGDEVVDLKRKNDLLNTKLNNAYNNISDKQIIISRLEEENATLMTIQTQLQEMQKVSTSLNASNSELKKLQDQMNKTILEKQKKNNDFKKTMQNE